MSQILVHSFIVLLLIDLILVQAAYDIDLTRYEILPPPETSPDYFEIKTIRVTKKSRNLFDVTGDMVIKNNLGPDIMYKMDYYQRSFTGRFVKLGTVSGSVCDISKMKFYKTMSEASNLPYPSPCPFPKGNYTFSGVVIDESFFPEVMPMGENCLKGYLILRNEIIMSTQMDTHIKPV